MQNYQDNQFKTAYKQAYSEACNALDKIAADGALEYICTTYTGGLCDGSTNSNNFDSFKNEFKVIKDCSSNNNSQCWDSTGDLYTGFWPQAAQKAFIDGSGKAWTMISGLNFIAVDTNGPKAPNKYGKDRFPLAWATAANNWAGVPNLATPRIFAPFDDVTSVTTTCSTGDCLFKTWLQK